MIASLSGTVAEKFLEYIVVEVGGVGYALYVTAEDYGYLAVDQPTKLYVYEHLRENTHDLYGFIGRDTKNLFELLLNVNGVGPKMALNMLSVGSPGVVRQAIASGDTKLLQQANGVGKRLAERLVVDLKDKVGLVGVDLESTGLLQSEATLIGDEAVQALVSLGYSPQDAAQALKNIDESLSTEERVKRALTN